MTPEKPVYEGGGGSGGYWDLVWRLFECCDDDPTTYFHHRCCFLPCPLQPQGTSCCFSITSTLTRSQPDIVAHSLALFIREPLGLLFLSVHNSYNFMKREKEPCVFIQLTWLQAFTLPLHTHRRNLKATPGPLGDAKQMPCQSTGTPTESELRWAIQVCPDLGKMCTLFSALGKKQKKNKKNKLNTSLYCRATLRCAMYANPSQAEREILRGHNDASGEKVRAKKQRGGGSATRGRILVWMGQWVRPGKREINTEKVLERIDRIRNRQQGADRSSQERQMERQGHIHTAVEKPLILISVTCHVWHRSDVF